MIKHRSLKLAKAYESTIKISVVTVFFKVFLNEC